MVRQGEDASERQHHQRGRDDDIRRDRGGARRRGPARPVRWPPPAERRPTAAGIDGWVQPGSRRAEAREDVEVAAGAIARGARHRPYGVGESRWICDSSAAVAAAGSAVASTGWRRSRRTVPKGRERAQPRPAWRSCMLPPPRSTRSVPEATLPSAWARASRARRPSSRPSMISTTMPVSRRTRVMTARPFLASRTARSQRRGRRRRRGGRVWRRFRGRRRGAPPRGRCRCVRG